MALQGRPAGPGCDLGVRPAGPGCDQKEGIMENQRNSRSSRLIIARVLVVLLAFFVTQGTGKKTGVSGKVTEIEKYGHALLEVVKGSDPIGE